MRRFIPLALALALTVVVGIITSCMDEEPSEISVIATFAGEARACTIQVYNSKSVQIAEIASDGNGIAYIKQLAKGKYKLKFVDAQRNMYPAEVEVAVAAGESLPVRVELDKAPEVPVDGAPSK